ncbi:hypothetical protein [Nocardia higoensis]|uniref:hypothetical protein n=1 Tax=Nocardia higoensis TaxID=228599 RepID=UPI0002DFCF5B|nr:hypothetical protein [Nocardia higoensis]
MNAPAVETTMPAQATTTEQVSARASAPRSQAVRPVCTAPVQLSKSATTIRPATGELSRAELVERLTAANQRAAELEEQLSITGAALDDAEHRAAQLEDRNRELASDLDNALDQLAGHALHAEQERLIRTPAWSPWPVSTTDREGFDR